MSKFKNLLTHFFTFIRKQRELEFTLLGFRMYRNGRLYTKYHFFYVPESGLEGAGKEKDIGGVYFPRLY